MKENNSYQDNIVKIFDNNMKPVISHLMPDELSDEAKKERLEELRDFMTTLDYGYSENDKVTYDGTKHVFQVPASLKENPTNDEIDLQHDLTQLALTSICPVTNDHTMSPYITLYADNLATTMVGNTTLETNENKYQPLNDLGTSGIDLLNDIFYTGNQEKIAAFKQGLLNQQVMNASSIDGLEETVKTRS